MATYLDKILDAHRAEARADGRSLDELIDRAASQPSARGFRSALLRSVGLEPAGTEARPAHAPHGPAVIAEVKRRSPSKGLLCPDLDPALLAGQYESGGAACLSVLTDVEYFGGAVADLQAARAACMVPVLRKDFTVSARDICDARLMGADAVLLIAAALDDAELEDFYTLALQVGLDVLVEIHDEAELERALAVDATLIGVNQRDLVTFAVDTERALRMAPLMPRGVVRVAESGVRGPTDALALASAGYHAVLVGETLVTSGDPAAAVASLRG